MAGGIAKGDGGAHLMTFHPTGDGRRVNGFKTIPGSRSICSSRVTGRAILPLGPDLDGLSETADQTHPRRRGQLRGPPDQLDAQNGYFNDFDVRKQAYWSVFAGAFGYTYGCHDIWQFFQPGREPISHAATHDVARSDETTWRGADAACWSVLMLSRPYLVRRARSVADCLAR